MTLSAAKALCKTPHRLGTWTLWLGDWSLAFAVKREGRVLSLGKFGEVWGASGCRLWDAGFGFRVLVVQGSGFRVLGFHISGYIGFRVLRFRFRI